MDEPWPSGPEAGQETGSGEDLFIEATDPPGSSFEPVDPSPYGSDDPAASRRRKRPLLLAGVGAAVLAAAGVGIAAGAGASASKPVQISVAASANNALAAKTVAIRASMANSSFNGQSFSMSGSGYLDFTTGGVELHVTIHASGQSEPVTAIYLGGSVYESIPQISTIEPGKHWVSQLIGTQAPGATSSLSTEGNDPVAMLSLLSQKGAAVVPAPDAVIGGRAVKVFDVTIPVAVIRQEARSSNFSAAVKQALSRDFMSDIRETVFIDHNNRLRRVHYTHSLTSGSGLTTAIDETMDFSDYGTPVSISAPAPSDTVDLQKLLADAKGLGLA